MFILVVLPLGDELGDVFVVVVRKGREPQRVLPRDGAVYCLLEQRRVTVVTQVECAEKPCSVQPADCLQKYRN